MVIDLGEARDEVELAPRPMSARQRRAVGTTLLLAALLAACGSAAPVRAELGSVTIRATAADEFILDDAAIYVLRPSRGVIRAGLRTITRYSLADATEPEWEARFYTDGPVRGAYVVDGVLLAIVDGGPEIQTVAIRLDTGAEVWRRSGWWHRTGPGRGLIQDYSQGLTQRLFSVDLLTGEVRWSLAFPADDQVSIEDDRFVHWTTTGTVEVYDADAGVMTVGAKVPFDPQTTAQVLDGLLLVPSAEGGRQVLTAYGLDRLDRRWQADVDQRYEYFGGDCGSGLCVGDINNGGIRFVDRSTGRTRWSAPGWGYAYQVGPYLLANGGGERTAPRIALLDPADGHVVGELGEWSTALPPDGGPALATREHGSRAVIARIDPIAMDVEVLGVLADVFQCQASPVAVVCRRAGGSIGVWYPRRKL